MDPHQERFDLAAVDLGTHRPGYCTVDDGRTADDHGPADDHDDPPRYDDNGGGHRSGRRRTRTHMH